MRNSFRGRTSRVSAAVSVDVSEELSGESV